ncbi:MAG TPA: hypothetical protein VJV23_12460 [Candidatus Polarisedimenticolia bacterium]|nr:hypothetical protein [Candidatus Polarisedimenticolia bacterium]
MRRPAPTLPLAAIPAAVLLATLSVSSARQEAVPPPAAPAARSVEVLSRSYLVDRKYRSMFGPSGTQMVRLLDAGDPELLWVTGFRAVMVGEDGEPISQEFMCHSNLDLNMKLHARLFQIPREPPSRVFTLSQGQQEIRFPEGFGLPVMSSEPFQLTTQVLNHNLEPANLQVRHKVTIDYLRHAELSGPIKPLMPVMAMGMVALDERQRHYNTPEPDPEIHGTGCLLGKTATAGHEQTDDFGRPFSGHWIVKPGREVNRTNVTRMMDLPFDTTIHYIAVHLHPFAESIELRDLTEGRTVYISRARASEGRIGLDHVDHYSSPEGLPLRKDREYELVSTYNNTTEEDQDSMAVLYMYALDREFRPPPGAPRAAVPAAARR